MKLTALEPEDLELLYTIENDPELWEVGNTTVPYSRYALKDYIATQQADIYADRQLRLVMRNDEGKAVGLADLFNFEPQHLRAEIGLAVLKTEQGRGYATQALQQLEQYAREVLHLHQLTAVISPDNEPTVRMFRKAGYADDIVLREWIRKGDGWQDMILFQKKM